ncbi:MAG: redoxin, partial [Gammaproteobacteria bacterium]|nr:redoxin [Gammaproteobacteria bacterium]
REEISTFGFTGPYIHDVAGDIARALRVRATTEVLVLDPSLTLIYRGGIDDQYGIAYTRNEVKEPWLRKAVDATLANTVPDVRHREEVAGCALGFHSGDDVEQVTQALLPEDGLTYHNRISRILEDNCVVCHRNGGIGPFALDNYKSAYGYRAMINYVLNEGLMPPWYAKPGISHYTNDRSLRATDRRALLQWTAGDAPEGDPALAVRHRTHAAGWTIGEPDYVAQLPEPQEVPAEGTVPYRVVYVKTDFPEDRWVKRLEIRPTAPEVTHHVIVTLEAPPDIEPPDPNRPWHEALSGFFAANGPGAVGTDFGEGKAKKLPAGAWLKFQLHYTTNGRATVDQTRLGFVFQDEPPDVEVETASAYNYWFKIPPFTKDHQVISKYTFPADGRLERVFPHTHNRGVAFRYDIIHLDGTETPVLQVPEYNFNWQLTYDFAEPPRFKKGDILRATAWYDNSEDNPYNPDPSKLVRHGEQTWDEMMIGYFDWTRTPAETTARN